MRNNRNQSSAKLDVDALRREAHDLKKAKGMQHAKALDTVARAYGFDKWTDLVAAQNDVERTEQRRAQEPYEPRSREPRFSLEDQPPEGAHASPFENPAYVRRIFRP
jgi:hypothetical protein